MIQNQCSVWANIYNPNSTLQLLDRTDWYGGYMGDSVNLKNQAGYHATGIPPSVCGFSVYDVEGIAGLESDGDITSSHSFSTWFTSLPLYNAAAYYPITLYPDGEGFYLFESNSFYPIDGELYGNEGQDHNRNFTFVIGADFTYHQCQDQILELQGSDDIWAFIGEDLVIDLGGLGANQLQIAEVDRMRLVDGETYTLKIYYAHRSSSTPSFRVRTNLDLHWTQWNANLPIHTGFD